MVINEVKDYDFDTAQLERKVLADLCIKEINKQYNPNVEYHYNIDYELLRQYENDLRELNGENALENCEL